MAILNSPKLASRSCFLKNNKLENCPKATSFPHPSRIFVINIRVLRRAEDDTVVRPSVKTTIVPTERLAKGRASGALFPAHPQEILAAQVFGEDAGQETDTALFDRFRHPMEKVGRQLVCLGPGPHKSDRDCGLRWEELNFGNAETIPLFLEDLVFVNAQGLDETLMGYHIAPIENTINPLVHQRMALDCVHQRPFQVLIIAMHNDKRYM